MCTSGELDLPVIGYQSGSVPDANRQLMRAVRELRQRKAYYRCCIPALAGFVSLRSIAPDGIVPLGQKTDRGKQKRKATPGTPKYRGSSRSTG
jgi:hypothetical protein